MDESLREKFSRDLCVNEVRKWEDLPTDCLVNIFEKVDTESMIENLPFVCKSWYKASLSPQCWKILDFSYFYWGDEYSDEYLESYAKRAIMFAVNRSCGKTSEVVFPCCFLDEHIVQHVLERCTELKSLIASSLSSDELEWITKQIYKLKDLESLTLPGDFLSDGYGDFLSDGYYVNEKILTEIHTHCKKFVSLTLRNEVNTKVASAIVTFVPNIKHLVLKTCDLPRKDLIVILSGCRELELLDVRGCTGFDADDAEILTMASHIKTFMSEGSVVEEEEEYDYPDHDKP